MWVTLKHIIVEIIMTQNHRKNSRMERKKEINKDPNCMLYILFKYGIIQSDSDGILLIS